MWTMQRLALAAVALPFGLQSGIPAEASMPVVVVATLCAVLLALGLLTRLGAAGASAVFFAALLAGGLALPLMGLALSIALVARGGGALSLDHAIVHQFTTLPLEQEMTTDGLIVGRRVGEYGA